MIDFEIIKVPFYKDEIEKFSDENDFMFALVELHKQIVNLLHKCSEKYLNSDDSPKTIDKDQAIIAGNIARLIKLNTSFVQNICEHKSEICFILDRCISETCINIKYILLNGETNVKRNYIKSSLITEKKLYNEITKNIQNRDGIELPIEERMKKSIENSFESSDFELEEINNSSRWKSVASRAQAIGEENYYNVLYGISSHSTHGNWQEILFNHLNENENGFEIDLNWTSPRPQLLEGVIDRVLKAIRIFAEKEITNNNYKQKVTEIVETFQSTLALICVNHEKLIIERTK